MPAVQLQEDEFRPRLDFHLWRRVFLHAWPHRRLLWPLLASAIVVAAIDASFALVTKGVIDDVVLHGAQHLVRWAVIYTALTAGLATCVWIFIDRAGAISNHVSHDIRRACFDRLQELEFSFYDKRPVGWLITRLTADCDRLARIIAWGFLDLVWGTCLVLMISVILLWLDWKLGLLVLAILPPLAFVSAIFQRKMILSAREIRKYNSQITAAYNEGIQGVRTTKTLVRERENLGEFANLSAHMLAASVRNARQSAIYLPLVLTLGSVGAGLALWAGGEGVIAGAVSLGTLVAFLHYAGQFFMPINQMASIFTQMQAAQAAGERVIGLLDTVPKIADSDAVRRRISDFRSPVFDLDGGAGNAAQSVDAAASALPQSSDRSKIETPNSRTAAAPDGGSRTISRIEFRGVTFAYDDAPPVLKDFNLTVNAGETIALVGPSGGGKSTIVSLVCRFYEPTAGAVLLDGTDYRERSLHWLQSSLGIVLQTPHLFKGSVRENIRYGRLDATDAEVEQAARLVNAHDFISKMEHGYASEVGEGGNRLSTGQKQLVSFARALLANPQVFVMDEATSSIDTETEHLIQDGLRQVMAGRISFVIAHRLSTIRRAHRILVIEKGRIAESGRHEELLAARGHYYELYTNQFRREREEAVLESANAPAGTPAS